MALSNSRAAPGAADDPDEVLEPDAVIDPPPEAEATAYSPSGLRLARATAGAVGHTGSWAARAYLRAGKRAVGIVVAPSTSVGLIRDVAAETTRALQTVAEVTDLERRLDGIGPPGALVKRAVVVAGSLLPVPLPKPAQTPAPTSASTSTSPSPSPSTPNGPEGRHNHNGRIPTLREQGEDLLRRSRDVDDEYDIHPAYARILSEIAPDEARVLQLMLIDGPQPTVDVRTGGPLGLINSRLIAAGLSMIGARAGCRYSDRVPSYLNNLFRLGLIWFSEETLRRHQRYQVLEAQPDVLEAIHSVQAAKLVRRSIHLTPFGEDFCRFCFTDGVDVNVLPEHSAPKETSSAPQLPEQADG